jgi:hypothetical protein
MRSLYRLLLQLHPRAFRQRFEYEMLLVFDDAISSRHTLWLLRDAAYSLVRQWAFRPPHVERETVLFASIETVWPRTSALLLGSLISTVVFTGLFGISGAPAGYAFVETSTHSTQGLAIPYATPLNSPAGQRLRQWLEAYNTGEPQTMRTFVVSYYATANSAQPIVERRIQVWKNIFQNFGRFDLESVHQSQGDFITGVVRTNKGGLWRIQVSVVDEQPYRIRELVIQICANC